MDYSANFKTRITQYIQDKNLSDQLRVGQNKEGSKVWITQKDGKSAVDDATLDAMQRMIRDEWQIGSIAKQSDGDKFWRFEVKVGPVAPASTPSTFVRNVKIKAKEGELDVPSELMVKKTFVLINQHSEAKSVICWLSLFAEREKMSADKMLQRLSDLTNQAIARLAQGGGNPLDKAIGKFGNTVMSTLGSGYLTLTMFQNALLMAVAQICEQSTRLESNLGESILNMQPPAELKKCFNLINLRSPLPASTVLSIKTCMIAMTVSEVKTLDQVKTVLSVAMSGLLTPSMYKYIERRVNEGRKPLDATIELLNAITSSRPTEDDLSGMTAFNLTASEQEFVRAFGRQFEEQFSDYYEIKQEHPRQWLIRMKTDIPQYDKLSTIAERRFIHHPLTFNYFAEHMDLPTSANSMIITHSGNGFLRLGLFDLALFDGDIDGGADEQALMEIIGDKHQVARILNEWAVNTARAFSEGVPLLPEVVGLLLDIESVAVKDAQVKAVIRDVRNVINCSERPSVELLKLVFKVCHRILDSEAEQGGFQILRDVPAVA